MIYACTTLGCLCFPEVFLSSRVTETCPVTTDLIMRVNVRTTTTTTYGEIGTTHVGPQQESKNGKKRRVGSFGGWGDIGDSRTSFFCTRYQVHSVNTTLYRGFRRFFSSPRRTAKPSLIYWIDCVLTADYISYVLTYIDYLRSWYLVLVEYQVHRNTIVFF